MTGRAVLRAATAAFAVCLACAGSAEERIAVPSGQPVTFHEIVRDVAGVGGLTFRFRFVAPEIAREKGSVDFGTAATDMEHLCTTYALPRISNLGPSPSQIVISLSDRPIEFGVAAPEATQFFEAFRPENGACVWEGF